MHHGDAKSKERDPSWLSLCKISEYPQEAPVLDSFFKKNAGLKACNFIKKRSKHRCFPVIFAKFLRIPILKNIYETAAFWPKGSKSRLHDCVRLPGPSHRSSFLFLSRYLVLNWVPTCVRKPKTNAFDESNKFLHWLLLVALGGFRSI